MSEAEALTGVRQCAVVDRQGPQVFLAVDGTRAEDELRAEVIAVARRLCLPRPAVHTRPRLPLSRSGKVDRLALALWSSTGPDSGNPGEVPADAAPPKDAVSFTHRVLGMDPVPDEPLSFVDAGVTSLDMMELVERVDRQFGVRFTVRDCFDHGDAASLARAIEAGVGGTARTSAPPREKGFSGQVVPLSTRQHSYMAVCMAKGNANWCNLSREITLGPDVTVEAVSAAVMTLLARHDVLRLSLTRDWSRQIHTAPHELADPVTEAPAQNREGLEGTDHRARVQRARVGAVSELIDPTIAPPFRAVLVTGEDTASLLVVAHHLFVDGLSMDLIADELRRLLTGETLDEAPPERGYRDYCRVTERVPDTSASDAGYWRDLLKDAAQVEISEGKGPGSRIGELLSRPFGVAATRSAHRLAREGGVSVFSVVLAAFETAVADTFGLTAPALVLPVQVREGAPAGSAGMFMSQLVVRDPGPGALLERARVFARQVAEGSARSGWEFDQRIAELDLADTDRFPLSTLLFNQHPRRRGLRVRDLGSWRPRSLGRELRYQLQGELQVSATEMVLTYYYRRGITEARADVVDRVHTCVLTELREAEEASDAR